MITIEMLVVTAFAIGVVIGWVGQTQQYQLDRLAWDEEKERLERRIGDLGG